MKNLKLLYICLIVALSSQLGLAGPDYELYVNGVHYKAPTVFEKGLPYFPVDILSEATGVRVVSYSQNSVRLAGSPVDFVPAVHKGRPYLPAEAFALATGSGLETDQTRGIVMYTKNPNYNGGGGQGQAVATPGASGSGAGAATNGVALPSVTGPGTAVPGVQAGDIGPELPVAAPAAAVTSAPANTEGLQDLVVDAMKTAQEVTYAQRWLKHKMYWVNQLDPANSPYLRVNAPPVGPLFTPHPWANP